MVPHREKVLQNWFALLAVVTVVAPLLTVAGVAGVSTEPVAGATAGTSTPDAPSFLQNNLTEARGDIVTVTVGVNNATEAILRIGSSDDTASDFTAEIAAEDRDGDGRIDVRVNTYTLGRDDGAIAARGEDTADVRRSSSLDAPLHAGNYSLTLVAGNETVDEGTLGLEPASVDDLTLRVANASVSADLSSQTAIRTAVENGTVHEGDRVSLGSTTLLELEAAGLSGALATQPGPNTTARFLALLDEPGVSLTIRENASTITADDDGVAFSLAPDATTVVADPRNDTYYVLVRLGALPREEIEDDGTRPPVDLLDVFDVNLTVTPDADVFERRQSVETSFEALGWVTAETPATVAPAPNQAITVRPNLSTGAPITVVLKTEDGAFQRVRKVEVGNPGRTEVTFDLSNSSVGEALTLVVGLGDGQAGDREVLYFERNAVRVTERGTPTATPTPSPTMTSTPTERPTATTAETTPTDDSPGSIPGFGAVAALVAVVAAAAVAASGRAA